MKFNEEQTYVLYDAICSDLSSEEISVVANPALSPDQMTEVKCAFERQVPFVYVKRIATPIFSPAQLFELRCYLEYASLNDEELALVLNPALSPEQIEEIFGCFSRDLSYKEVSLYVESLLPKE